MAAARCRLPPSAAAGPKCSPRLAARTRVRPPRHAPPSSPLLQVQVEEFIAAALDQRKVLSAKNVKGHLR